MEHQRDSQTRPRKAAPAGPDPDPFLIVPEIVTGVEPDAELAPAYAQWRLDRAEPRR